jgi:hypothetical protein
MTDSQYLSQKNKRIKRRKGERENKSVRNGSRHAVGQKKGIMGRSSLSYLTSCASHQLTIAAAKFRQK